MALDLDIMADDFADMVADLPHYLTFGDVTSEVVFNDVESSETADLAGMIEGADGEAWYAIDSEVTIPAAGDVVTIAAIKEMAGTKYRVVRASEAPDGKVIKLTLKAEEE